MVSQTSTFTATAMVEGCDVEGQMTVNIENNLMASLPSQTICPNVETQLIVDLSTITDLDPTTFMWGEDTGTGCDNCLDPTISISGPTTFLFSGLTTFGCALDGTWTVNVFGSDATLTCSPDEPSFQTGTVVTLSVNSTGLPTDAEITWTAYGETTTTTENSFELTVRRDPASTTVTAQYIDINGCLVTTQPKTINSTSPPPPEVPTAFAPESGQNNRFRVLNINAGIRVGKVLVFNRWGQKMFDGTGAEAEWDGRIGGKFAPSDVYVYVVEIDFGDGNFEELRGDLLLVR
jgi:gliding motility-associated-like protein